LQKLAEATQLLVAQSSRRQIGRRFELVDIGDRDIKGIDQPVRVWRVVQPSSVESRFEARQSSQLTPFVGRDSELAMLLTRYEMAKRGEGQVILIFGEPGIGKSRLAMALSQQLATGTSQFAYQCSPFHTSSAWFPIIRH